MNMTKTYTDTEKRLLCERAASSYRNIYDCDLYGRFPWDTELRGDQYDDKTKKNVSLSKSCLGELCYEVLIRGGDLTNFFCLDRSPRSFVGARIKLTLDARDDMVSKTRFVLNPPPIVNLN